ncbi:MAG: hypothetical protein ACYC7E_15850 [Armatimonadota bacterium]
MKLSFSFTLSTLSCLSLALILCGWAGISAAAVTMTLPPSLPRDGFHYAVTDGTPADRWTIETGGVTFDTNNVNSLWAYDDPHQPPSEFTRDAATAVMQAGVWVKATHGRWVYGFGYGKRDSYQGNSDAGQLWLDLHTDNPPIRTYNPEVVNLRDAVSWAGVGQRFPVGYRQVQGKAEVFFRALAATDLMTRSVTGEVQGSDYTGMVRKIVSADRDGVRAWGWALDARMNLRLNDRWEWNASADGVLGQLYWQNALIGDYYVTSPQVFQDPDGFLHNFWGFTGQTWIEDLTVRVNPVYVTNLTYRGKPDLLFGLLVEDGVTQPNLGAGWRTRQGALTYARLWPNTRSLELGTVGRHWQLSIAGDGWIVDSKHHLAITLALGPLVF